MTFLFSKLLSFTLSGGIERMTDSRMKLIRRDWFQHHRSDVHPDSISHPTGHDTHSLENMTICGHISIPNHLEGFLVCFISETLTTRIKQKASPPLSSRLFRISYTLWPVDSVNRQNMYCFRTQWKRSLETLRSSAHWTALAMGFLTYSWRRTTLLCLQKLATSLKQKVVLSASIKPYVFTNLAWDNLDRLEETLTEKMEK